MPPAAQRTLLAQLAQAGARLRYHGDFDWPGLRIANYVMRTWEARPWRFMPRDYEAAATDAPHTRRDLDGAGVEASWDAAVAPAMRRHGVAIAEVAGAASLLEDLGRPRPGRSEKALRYSLVHSSRLFCFSRHSKCALQKHLPSIEPRFAELRRAIASVMCACLVRLWTAATRRAAIWICLSSPLAKRRCLTLAQFVMSSNNFWAYRWMCLRLAACRTNSVSAFSMKQCRYDQSRSVAIARLFGPYPRSRGAYRRIHSRHD